MEFLENYYVFILLFIIIGLMALIGYYAEKTDFGRKSIKKNKMNEKATKTKPEKITVDNKGINDINNNINDINIEHDNIVEIDESLYEPLTDSTNDKEETKEKSEDVEITVHEEPKKDLSMKESSVDDDIWKF